MKAFTIAIVVLAVGGCIAEKGDELPSELPLSFEAWAERSGAFGRGNALLAGENSGGGLWVDRLGFSDLVGIYRISKIVEDKYAGVHFEMTFESAPLVLNGPQDKYATTEVVGPNVSIRSAIPGAHYKVGTRVLVVGWKNEYSGELSPTWAPGSVFVLDDSDCLLLGQGDGCLPLADLLAGIDSWVSGRTDVTSEVFVGQADAVAPGRESVEAHFESLDVVTDGLADLGLDPKAVATASEGLPEAAQYAAFQIPKSLAGDRFEVQNVVLSGADAYVRIDKFFGDEPFDASLEAAVIMIVAVTPDTKIERWHHVVFAGE